MPTMEIEMEPEPIRNENFITKWVGAFSNTVSVWIQNAGKYGSITTFYLSLGLAAMIVYLLLLCISSDIDVLQLKADQFIHSFIFLYNFICRRWTNTW